MEPQTHDHTSVEAAGQPEVTSPEGQLSRRRFLGLSVSAGAVAAVAAGASHFKMPSHSTGTSTKRASTSTKRASINILDDNTNDVWLNGGIDQFEKQTGIKVASYEQMSFEELVIKLPILFGSHSSSYDVVDTWAAWTAAYGSAGWLQQLSTSDIPADLLPGPRDAVTWGGMVFGVPKYASVETMFYNKPLFEKAGLDPDKPPTNWVELATMAAAMKNPPIYGYVSDEGNTEGAYQAFLRALLCCGGEMWDSNYNVRFNSPAGVNALTHLADLFLVQKVADPASLSIMNSIDLNPIFADGTAAIMFDWPYGYAAARAKMSAKDIGNAIIPGITVRSASIDGSAGFAINAFSTEKSAALEWLRFAASPYAQRRIVLEEGWLPVTSSLLHEPDLVAALPVITTYGEQTKYVIKRYGAPWYDQVCEGYVGTNVVKAVLGQLSPKAALDQAASVSQPVIDTFVKSMKLK